MAGDIVDGLECVKKDLDFNWIWLGASEAAGGWGDVVKGGGSGDDPGCRVLDQLKLMKGFMRGIEKEWVAIIDVGGDEAVDQDSSSVRSEKGAEMIRMTPRHLTWGEQDTVEPSMVREKLSTLDGGFGDRADR